MDGAPRAEDTGGLARDGRRPGDPRARSGDPHPDLAGPGRHVAPVVAAPEAEPVVVPGGPVVQGDRPARRAGPDRRPRPAPDAVLDVEVLQPGRVGLEPRVAARPRPGQVVPAPAVAGPLQPWPAAVDRLGEHDRGPRLAVAVV